MGVVELALLGSLPLDSVDGLSERMYGNDFGGVMGKHDGAKQLGDGIVLVGVHDEVE